MSVTRESESLVHERLIKNFSLRPRSGSLDVRIQLFLGRERDVRVQDVVRMKLNFGDVRGCPRKVLLRDRRSVRQSPPETSDHSRVFSGTVGVRLHEG